MIPKFTNMLKVVSSLEHPNFSVLFFYHFEPPCVPGNNRHFSDRKTNSSIVDTLQTVLILKSRITHLHYRLETLSVSKETQLGM